MHLLSCTRVMVTHTYGGDYGHTVCSIHQTPYSDMWLLRGNLHCPRICLIARYSATNFHCARSRQCFVNSLSQEALLLPRELNVRPRVGPALP